MSTKQLRTTLTAAQLAASGQFLTATSTDAGADLGHTTRAEAKSALGLGTSLTVTANNGSGTADAPAYTFAGDLDTGMWRPAANTLAFSTDGTQKVTVLENGHVGIGVSQPAQRLHVDGNVIGSNFTSPVKNYENTIAGNVGRTWTVTFPETTRATWLLYIGLSSGGASSILTYRYRLGVFTAPLSGTTGAFSEIFTASNRTDISGDFTVAASGNNQLIITKTSGSGPSAPKLTIDVLSATPFSSVSIT